MLKRFKTLALRAGISILSLALLFWATQGKLFEAFGILRGLSPFFLIAALVLNFVSLIPVTHRLGTVLSIQGIHLSFWRRYYLWALSLFFNLFLPSAVGGDIAKAYYIYKDSGKKMGAVTGVLWDRFFGLLATLSIGLLAVYLVRNRIDNPRIIQWLFWIVVFLVFGALFVMSRRFSSPVKTLILQAAPKRFHEKMQRFLEALELFRDHRLAFFSAYGYSVLAQCIFVLIVYLLARSIQIDLPIAVFFLFMPFVTLFSLVPSIGGLGVREASTVYLFRHLIPLHQAVALSLLFDLFLYGVGASCGILYAVRGGASLREIERLEEDEFRRG